MVIAHLTSAHPRYDVRIFKKMCISLASSGHQAHLIVADGFGDEVCEHVRITDVGASQGRLDRILNAPKRIYAKALKLNADVFHLHDPELIPIGLMLKNAGKRVIFDSHEDVAKQILSKPYLNFLMRFVIARLYEVYEAWACSRLDGVVTATPFIRDKFLKINRNTTDINNFPLIHELSNDSGWTKKRFEVCYVGGIGRIRGILEVCQALSHIQSNTRLNLVGIFGEPVVEKLARQSPGWSRVNELGYLSRDEVGGVLERSIAGLVTFLPVPNHIDAQPNKMFEYMSAGIPVIASDFPLWREIIVGNDCGIVVDPLRPDRIAQAIDYFALNPREAQRMGSNGRKAVMSFYNWTNEESKLINFYMDVINRSSLPKG
jgi:glycosyltransferase involved in cell wall biosynthesis